MRRWLTTWSLVAACYLAGSIVLRHFWEPAAMFTPAFWVSVLIIPILQTAAIRLARRWLTSPPADGQSA